MSNTPTIPARSVDIRRLWHGDMPAFRDHLLRLDSRSRQHRFGGGMSDDFIADYAVSCFGQGDLVFGAFVDGRLRGAGELRSKEAIWSEQAPFQRHIHAEAAFSVEDDFRRRGIGEQLFPRSLYVGKMMDISATAHQNGTVRFGTDPHTSALNVMCKAHDLDNLYVVDGSFFPSPGAVNPALTIIANALRVGDHLIERLR